jgi:hypothetical protein
MSKEKQIRPLQGDAYMQFLKASASAGDKWPQWVKGERDSSVRTATPRTQVESKTHAGGSVTSASLKRT